MNAGKGKPRLQGKKPSHRRALIKSQIVELLRTGQIKTTTRKAKVLRSEFDKLVSLAKRDTSASRTKVKSILADDRAEKRLYQLLPKLENRSSGYTKVVKTLNRAGDAAELSYVLFVDDVVEDTSKSQIAKALERQNNKK